MKLGARRQPLVAALAAASLLSSGSVGAAAPAEPGVPLVLVLDDAVRDIGRAIPDKADHPSVRRLGRTSEPCATEALGQARESASRAGRARLALAALKIEVLVPRRLLGATGDPGNGGAARLFESYVASGGMADFVARTAGSSPPRETSDALEALHRKLASLRSEQAFEPVLSPGCRPGFVVHDVRPHAELPGRLVLRLLAEGGCGCSAAATPSAPRRWHLLGEADLEPGPPSVDSAGVKVVYAAGEPRFALLAACGGCRGNEEREAPVQASVSGCGQPCTTLAQGAASWAGEASKVEAELRALDDKKQAIDATMAARQRDRAAIETRTTPDAARHRARLADEVRSLREQLASLSGAVAEARDGLDGFRRAADAAADAERQCQVQCQAKQDVQARRQPPPKAGGMGKPLLIGGVAAVGAVAGIAASGEASGSATPVPTPVPTPAPLDVTGRWAGIAVSDPSPRPECGRYEASLVWELQQNGTSIAGTDSRLVIQTTGPSSSCGSVGDTTQGPLTGSLQGNLLSVAGAGGRCIVDLTVTGRTMNGTSRLAPGSPGPCGGTYTLSRQ